MAVADPAITPPVPPLISEAVSQNAYKLQTPQAFEQFVSTQPGGASLTPAQKQTLYGTVSKTRETHGLPAPPPPGIPQVAPGPISPAPPPAVPPAGGASPAATAPGGAPSPPLGNAAGPAAPPVDYNTPLKSPDPLVVPPPPAHETVPQFQGAEYHKPAKGLEYLALGIGLLFPGAPIGKAAASFAQGLNQGADSRYKRDEGAAEKQYEVKKAQADVDARGAQNDFNVALEQAKAKQAGSVADTNIFNERVLAAQQQHVTDVKDGKFFKIPAELTRILPPGTNRPVTEADYANHFQGLARAAMTQGATGLAGEYTKQAEDWNKAALKRQSDDDALKKMWYTFQQQDHLASVHEAGSDRRAAASDARADRRDAIAERRMDDMEDRVDSGRLQTVRNEAGRAGQDFSKVWATATTPGTGTRAWAVKDKDGNLTLTPSGQTQGAVAVMTDKQGHIVPFGTPLPAEISDTQRGVITQMIKRIQTAPDPQGLALHLADSQQNGAVKEVLNAAGNYAGLTRQASGGRIIPQPESYYDRVIPKTPAPKEPTIPADIQKQISGLPAQAQSSIRTALDSGQTVDQIIATAREHNLADVVSALTAAHAGPTPHSGPAGLGAPGNPTDSAYGYKPGTVWDPRQNKFVPLPPAAR